MDRKRKLRGVSSIIGGCLILITCGNIYTYGNTNKYFYSYIFRWKNEKFSQNDAFLMMPFASFFMNIAPTYSGYLGNKLDIRILFLIGLILSVSGNIILRFATNLFPMILAMILFGNGSGLVNFNVMRVCWKYFPEKNGLVSGILIACFGLAALPFTSIADAIINPEGLPTEEKEAFSKDIAKKYEIFLYVLIGTNVLFYSLAMLLVKPFKEDDYITHIKILVPDRESEYITNNIIENKDKEVDKKSDIDPDIEKLQYSLKTLEYVEIAIFGLCYFFYGFALSNTYRAYGREVDLPESLLQTLSKIFAVVSAVTRLLAGKIYDKLGFFWPSFVLSILQIASSALISFSTKHIGEYYAVCLVGALCLGGMATIHPTIIRHIFGMKNSVSMIGYCSIFNACSCLFGAFLCKYLIHSKNDYKKVYFTACGLSVVSFIIVLILNTNKFDYVKAHDKYLSKIKNKDINGENIEKVIDGCGLVNNIIDQEIKKN